MRQTEGGVKLYAIDGTEMLVPSCRVGPDFNIFLDAEPKSNKVEASRLKFSFHVSYLKLLKPEDHQVSQETSMFRGFAGSLPIALMAGFL